MKKLSTGNLYLTFLRKFYRIEGELDEYSLSEINTFGNHMFMFLYSGITLAFLLSLFAIDIWYWVIFLGLLIPLNGQVKLIKRLELDKLEVEQDQLKTAKRTMFKRTLWQTLIVAVTGVLVSLALWRMGIPQEDGTSPEVFFKIATPGSVAIISIIAFFVQLRDNFRKIKIID